GRPPGPRDGGAAGRSGWRPSAGPRRRAERWVARRRRGARARAPRRWPCWWRRRTARSRGAARPSWQDQLEPWKVRAISRGVPCQQRNTAHGRVGADVEVGQGRAPGTAGPAIPHEALAGEKRRFPRQRFAAEGLAGQGGIEFLDPLEADGDLGIHDRVDDELVIAGHSREDRRRAVEPSGILGNHVENDVAVDEDVRHRPLTLSAASTP